VSAIATTIASIIALFSLIYLAVQQRDIRREQSRLTEERLQLERARRREHAAGVVVRGSKGKTLTSVGVEIINLGDRPIFDPTAVVFEESGEIYRIERCADDVVPPGDTGYIEIPGVGGRTVILAACFVDDNGLAWFRDGRNRLHEGAFEHPAGTPLVPWS
jgi:hypothetical protein